MATAAKYEAAPVTTVAALVDRAAALSTGEAMVLPDERATFAEFAELTRVMARRLRAAGVEHGDRVGLLNTDSVESLAVLFGAMRIGAVPVPVNARYKARELSYVVENAGMHLLLLDPQFATLLEDAELPDGSASSIGLDEPAFVGRRRGGRRRRARGPLEAAVRPDDAGHHPLHVGDDREPEGLRLNHEGIAAQAFDYGGDARADARRSLLDAAAALPRQRRSSRCSRPLPWPCASRSRRAPLRPGPALEQLERERCTLAFPCVRDDLARGAERAALRATDLRSLRLVIAVGSPGALRLMQARLPYRDAGLLVREHGVRRLRLDRPHDRPAGARA